MASCGVSVLLVLVVAVSGAVAVAEVGVGVNWGTLANHPLPPKTVAQLLKDNGVGKVKLFDADQATMSSLAGTGIEVMVAIPNDMLAAMTDYEAAKEWVKQNVTRYNFEGGVNIKYVAVGNEPFLKSYNNSFVNVTFPALQNIQNALGDAGLGDTVKATIPLNADVYESPSENDVPSAGRFRADINDLMTKVVKFFNESGAPFTVNIYPFLSLYGNLDFPIDYAFFDGTSKPVIDGNIQYNNVFDANFDTLVSALNKAGFGNLPIIVGEVGWPTDGDINAKASYAERFYNGLLKRLASNQGTPLRPNAHIDVYLFGLLDEDAKSVAPGNFERHWGIFTYDGQPKFPMDLSGPGQSNSLVGAKNVNYLPQKWCVYNPDNSGNQSTLADNVNYACAYADCTSLGYGSSCNNMDAQGNASYAFNMYFQAQNQKDESCDFQGLAMVTTQNYSKGSCKFIVELAPSSSAPPLLPSCLLLFALLSLLLAG